MVARKASILAQRFNPDSIIVIVKEARSRRNKACWNARDRVPSEYRPSNESCF